VIRLWPGGAARATRQDWLCNVCKVDLCGIAFDIDHVQRLDALGKHEPENWQALCVPCHAIKTKTDNREAKKGRRIRGEAGQQARRAKNGPQITSRGFQKRPDGVKHQWPKRKLGQ
jgi:5-methylcytosine-specific restriction endonuclease McrA